jgi:phenylacetate-coenzyme A ligase PaaK-like adenylate-forming protein
MKFHTDQIFNAHISFEERTRQVFDYQFEYCKPYRVFCESLGVTPDSLSSVSDIPFYPIDGFKRTTLRTSLAESVPLIFKSSGTSGMERSVHQVADESVYRRSILEYFSELYHLKESVILAYTPGYAENPHSSLIHMMEVLIEASGDSRSAFLPLNQKLNQAQIDDCDDKQIILFGAAFGLLDLTEISEVRLPESAVVIETGGMKTHRREIPRVELHERLSEGFCLSKDNIHSEYGMAELLSQSYMTDGERFVPPHWMRVFAIDPQNPMQRLPSGETGQLAIIDLANVFSCSFILTEDEGRVEADGSFTVNGRISKATMRGCNFLIDRD